MSRTRIGIIAIGNDKVYYVGEIVVLEEGDVYLNYRIKDSGDYHLSRHASGITHWKSRRKTLCQHIRKGQPIKEFKEFEDWLQYFSLDALPELYKEYKMKVCDGIFCVDRRAYSEGAFNMRVGILSKDGLPSLLTWSERLSKRQVYIFPDCHPMIVITVGDAQIESAKSQ